MFLLFSDLSYFLFLNCRNLHQSFYERLHTLLALGFVVVDSRVLEFSGEDGIRGKADYVIAAPHPIHGRIVGSPQRPSICGGHAGGKRRPRQNSAALNRTLDKNYR